MNRLLVIIAGITLCAGCTAKLTEGKKEALKTELKEMVKIDQVAAFIRKDRYTAYTNEQWAAFKDSVFSTNQKKAASMFRRFGFPGFDKVGKEGSQDFWLIIQHCDKYPAFQKKVLAAMDREVKKGNAHANNYAYLYDRVSVNAGEKQLFGTQVDYEVQTTGRAIPKIGLIDPAHVDSLRNAYRLGKLKDYLNEMTTLHYEMNRQHYEKMGIARPYTYE